MELNQRCFRCHGFTDRCDRQLRALTHMAESAELESDITSDTIRLAGGPGPSGFTLQIWLGWLDLNQQMPVSETGALTIWRHPSILAGIGRLEHPRAVLGTAVLPVKLYPCMMMVMPAGFEPSITSLRGLRPNQLDEGTRWRYGSDSNRRLTALQAVLFNLLSTVSWLG